MTLQLSPLSPLEPSQSQAKFEAGIPLEPPEHEKLAKLIGIAKYTGVPQALSMTFEGLQRGDNAFRQAILTARGRVPVEEFPAHFKAALEGDLKQSNREFMDAFLSKEIMANLDQVSLIPGWTKTVLNPDTHLAQQVPKVSLANVVDFGADFWASPWAYFALTPVEAGAKKLLKPLTDLPLWSPLRGISRGVDNMLFSTASKLPSPIASLIMHLREPSRALERHQDVILALERDRDLIRKNLADVGPRLHQLFFTDQKVAGVALRSVRNHTEAEHQNVFKHLFSAVAGTGNISPAVQMSNSEQALYEGLMDVFEPMMQRGQAMGYVSKTWTRADGLAPVIPSMVDLKSLPADIMQSWDWKTLGILNLYVERGAQAGLKARTGLAALSTKLQARGLPALSDANLDLVTATRDMAMAFERKLVWNAKQKVTRQVSRQVATGLLDAFGSPITTTVSRTKTHYEAVGSLLKYKPRATTNLAFQNPNVAGWSKDEREYMVRLINEIQGKARGRAALSIGETVKNFATNLKEGVEKNRVSNYFWDRLGGKQLFPKSGSYDFPEFVRPQYASLFFTHNIVRGALWGNLSSAIKNTSQLVNTAIVKGLPATIAGMFKLSNPEYWKLARTEAFGEFRKLLAEESVTSHLGQRLDTVLMAPFNLFENLARGTSFNVYLDDFMRKKGASSIADLRAKGLLDEATRHAVRGSYETNFIYGVLGRPASFLGSPLLRPATTLLSYGPKQAEFFRRAFLNDGSALVRAIGLHGWLIDMGNKHGGIAPESWLGWGFLPPTQSVEGLPLATSPQIQFALALGEGLAAHAAGDDNAAAAHYKRASGSWGQILDTAPELIAAMKGETPDPAGLHAAHTGLKLALGAGQSFMPWMPFPAVAIARTLRAVTAFKTGTQTSGSGETWVPVTRADAVRSAFFQTTTAKAREDLHSMTQGAQRRVDHVLDERVREYLAAGNDRKDGDRVIEAARNLAAPIRVSHGLTSKPAVTWIPHPEMVESRIQRQIGNRTQNRDLLEMQRAGFLSELYWSQYLSLVMRGLE